MDKMSNRILQITCAIIALFVAIQAFQLFRFANKTANKLSNIELTFAEIPETSEKLSKIDSMRLHWKKEKIDKLPSIYEKLTNSIKEINTAANYYLFIVLGLLVIAFVLPRISTFNLTNGGISFTLQKEIEELKSTNNELQKALVINNIQPNENHPLKTAISDDPQKGRWGGKSISNNRKLSATFSYDEGQEFCKIFLKVESTSPVIKPLKDTVIFHLHDSFINQNPTIFVYNGVAELTLMAWGGFTVGAETDNGTTHLELNLAELDDAPSIIKNL